MAEAGRAAFMAVSLASVPLLTKNVFFSFPGASCASFSARSLCVLCAYSVLMWLSFFTWSTTA